MPFIEHTTSRQDFYALFKSIEVVPECYEEDFWAKIDNREYYEAQSYIVQISDKQFKQFDKDGQLYEKKRLGQLGQWFIKVLYDPTLGLRL